MVCILRIYRDILQHLIQTHKYSEEHWINHDSTMFTLSNQQWIILLCNFRQHQLSYIRLWYPTAANTLIKFNYLQHTNGIAFEWGRSTINETPWGDTIFIISSFISSIITPLEMNSRVMRSNMRAWLSSTRNRKIQSVIRTGSCYTCFTNKWCTYVNWSFCLDGTCVVQSSIVIIDRALINTWIYRFIIIW